MKTKRDASAALAEFIKTVNKAPKNPRKIKVLMGDGYDPSQDLQYPGVILGKDVPNPSYITHKDHSILYKAYEYSRLKTSHQYPDPLLYYLSRLSKQDIVSTIITTNYDCYWSSIIDKKAISHDFCINPLASSGDIYYSKILKKRHLKIFMIHGRLDFGRHNDCQHRFQLSKLPRHWLLRDIEVNAKKRTDKCAICSKKNLLRHDIDWLNEDNRDPYQVEIIESVGNLFDPKTTAGILVLGFSGYYSVKKEDKRKIEELVPEFLKAAKIGKIPIWIAVTKSQFDKMQVKGEQKYLRKMISSYDNIFITPPIEDRISTWLEEILSNAGINIYSWKTDYDNEWMFNRKRFVDRTYYLKGRV